jgi:hypothetical protein
MNRGRLRLLALLMLLLVPAPAGGQASAGMALGRLHYDGGGDWYANPSSLPNLARAIRTGTQLPVEPREVVVRLTDDQLWSVPFLHATGHGNLSFSEAERAILRRWLRQGGFLHVSDNYGLDESFRREMARLFPDHPLVPVPLTHPVFHLVYDLPAGVPKIHEHDGKPAEGLGIFLDGRLVVFYDYQADLGDGWEDAEVHRDPAEKHEAALHMGVNLFAYAVGFAGAGP